MRIHLHIGLDAHRTAQMQRVMSGQRDQMAERGNLFARSPGAEDHARLFMAVTDHDHIDPLRFGQNLLDPNRQRGLREALIADLDREIARARPENLILSCAQLGTALHRESELDRLKTLLNRFSDDISIVAHVDEPARMLARHYAAQVMTGRTVPLSREIELAQRPDWWRACIDAAPDIDPSTGVFEENQGAPFWLDYTALVRFWESAFGPNSLSLRPLDPARFKTARIADEIRESFGLMHDLAASIMPSVPPLPSAEGLARARQLNVLICRMLGTGRRRLPLPLWQSFLREIQIDGAPLAPGSLCAVSERFRGQVADLVGAHPALGEDTFAPDFPDDTWQEADPGNGFRASQYLLGFMYRIDKAQRAGLPRGHEPQIPVANGDSGEPGPEASAAILPPLAARNLRQLRSSHMAPHNRMGATREDILAPAFDPVPPRILQDGSSGKVIVACMKNEAPYILEWVAYHRSIGVDTFVIYTNDCDDGTSEILERLQAMGVLHHRSNDIWKGKSPQQHALNRALKEPVVSSADWIVHIDVDEFINVRAGNGTLDDFLALVPDASNIAMTWRLFGHNGIRRLGDEFVIDQFDTCAPKYCPKPHTVWGFKTMFRNIGAYEKMSCHRPNKLDPAKKDNVRWVNGSGEDMTSEVVDRGWRNSRTSVGYDLLQLNHYALRSADSFLVKRQRGRALHVDRSIGLNYWIRMDWSGHRDVTIKRNIPRVRAEYDRLLQDDTIRHLHRQGLEWHHAKAEELRGMPEFEDLYQQALRVRLTDTERAAYALALDMES
ncbi:glycosyltransferase family 2 protein [Sedimentitalea sp. JM2-8]|uniref:Glycosyltransferase family 2 protein n=1 Tax=Sedimentitalea xiamensis TaxID=3050037 RepID=A0ABT7F9X2_9RHOB|nr:glycosyltransferase family 2 protein [Sedimentitalea xiamensis]MDK3071907.1 glycosyltransferase family 2 protein [Sedimentitalea xiamensis]